MLSGKGGLSMNNVSIIALEKERLANEGLLKFTGGTVTVFDPKTEAEFEIPEVEEINTVAGWNKRGYKVKKGATCGIKFKIWTYKKGKAQEQEPEDGEQEQEQKVGGKCYMKMAYWFTRDQVEPIPVKS